MSELNLITVSWSVCGMSPMNTQINITDLPKLKDVVSPFNQSYKYTVIDIKDEGSNLYSVNLFPKCNRAKIVFQKQYGCMGEEEWVEGVIEYLEEVFPICISKDGYTINLAGMEKHSPTGDNWGYAPFQKTYKTQEEAEKVRKELWKTIKRWVDNYASVDN